MFAVILADHHLRHFVPWTGRLGYYVFENGWKLLSPGDVREFGLLVANSIDVLLLSIAIGLIVGVVRGRARLVLSADGAFALLYLLTLAAMFAYGLVSGGELKPALWQVRPLAYFAVFALLGIQSLQTPAPG